MCTRTTTTEKPEKPMDLGQQASIGNSTAGEHTVMHPVRGLCSLLSIIIFGNSVIDHHCHGDNN